MSPESVTVVSGYYPIQSKRDDLVYSKWVEQFWPQTSCNLIWFTVPRLVKTFSAIFEKKIADGTVRVYGVPLEEFRAMQDLNPVLWTLAAEKDPEEATIHLPEIYMLWYEKREFVRRAMAENPFGSDLFVWCDGGCVRDPKLVPALSRTFPIAAHISRGRMLVLEVTPFAEKDWVAGEDGICGIQLDQRNTVGTAILASDREGWERWATAYDRMFMRYLLAGRYFGNDRAIAASMILEDRGLAARITAPPFLGLQDRWLYLMLFLAGVPVRQA